MSDLTDRPIPLKATQNMKLMGARSIANTMKTPNYIDRAEACWNAMIAASLEDAEEPNPSGDEK